MGDLEMTAERLRVFARDREWEQFHSPRNLVLAMIGELGELAEQIQWRADEEIVALMKSSPELLASEIADITIYAIRLADVLGIDLQSAIDRKIGQNEARYPVEKARGRATKYTEFEEESQ